MPGSALTRASSSSSSSKKGRHRQYRTISNHSQVDETLFGKPNHIQKRSTELQWDRKLNVDQQVGGQKKKATEDKESVQIIMMDLIRNLIIPSKDPSGQSVILRPYDYDRIKDNARVLTVEEKKAYDDYQKQKKEEAQQGRLEREHFMKKMDQQRQKAEKLSELELEAKLNAENVLTKANEQRQEQEDEIKHLNELILEAKCHAIRDAQVEEKRQIKTEMQSEVQRLDAMMEVDRQNAIKIQEEIEKRRKIEQRLGAIKLKEQISDIEQKKLLDLEAKEAENVIMQQKIDKMITEDNANVKKKKLEQIVLRDELQKANQELLHLKARHEEQERLEELNVLEFQKQKAERETAFEAEQEKIRIEKEREIARLRALQERAHDERAERDAVRAKRAMEEAEREWRKKEVHNSRKKTEMETRLIDARKQQMHEKEHFMAVQAQRDRVEFENILRAQKDVLEKERREDQGIKLRALKYSKELRSQITNKEQDKIHQRQVFFSEGKKYKEEDRLHKQKLNVIKEKKLQELRNAGIPDRYLGHVERVVNKTLRV